jgi:hypothetical protein
VVFFNSPVQAQLGRLAHLQVQVVRLGLDRGFEVLVQLGLFLKHLMRVEWLLRTHTPVNSNNAPKNPSSLTAA